MSRRTASTKPHKQAVPPPVNVVRDPVTLRLVRGVLKLPRPLRMMLVAVFALAVTFAVSPVIDAVYIRYFFSETTRVVPSLVAAAAGLVMYALGWVVLIGTVGETPPERILVLWYSGLGLLVVALVIIMLAAGWMSGLAPTM
ncbi:MAG: hypothetical protein HZC41_17360 [Chloroflexi bacterium]|nr:hypothetical protein [Chloroflexota bacterium]